MSKNDPQRFGVHEVQRGPRKGSLHYAGDRYVRFLGELAFIVQYLEHRLVPTEPEEAHMRSILLDAQNILEYESEELIRHYVKSHSSERYKRFVKAIDEGFVSFRSKYDWLRAKRLIGDEEWSVLDEIRVLRNSLAHARPAEHRVRYRYRGVALLTRTSIRNLLTDTECVLRKLRDRYGAASKWGMVPPGYASEMGWPKRAIEVFDGKK